jgi:hypothetical protein
MMGKRVEDPDKSYINVFPSGVYISSHGLSTLLPGIDQKSCKILYKEYGASILEDEKGIYKVYQVRKEDDWTTIPDVVGDTIKEKDYTLQ